MKSRAFLIAAVTTATFACADNTGPKFPSTVVVSPAVVAMDALGLTTNFTVEALDEDGNQIVGETVTWSSSATQVVAVSDNGLATAIGNGTGVIRATVLGVTGSANVTVAQVVAEIAIDQTAPKLSSLGETIGLVAVPMDSRENVIDGLQVTWNSDNPDVAIVDANGLVTATGNGTAEVVASAEGKTAKATVTVEQVAAKLAITVQPAGASSGKILSTQPVVQIQDSLGSAVEHDVTTVVVAEISDGGILRGSATATAVNGVAPFSGLIVAGQVNNRTITFSTPGLPDVVSDEFLVTAGEISTSQSTVAASLDTVTAGSQVAITVTALDESGNQLPEGGASLILGLSSGIGVSSGYFSSVIDNNDGTYSATFTGTVAGRAVLITALMDGDSITSERPTVTVVPGAIDVATSVVDVSTNSIVAGQTTTVTLTAYDQLGNKINEGGEAVGFTVSGGTSTGSFGSVADNGDGTYTALFTGEIAGTVTEVAATINGQSVTSSMPEITVIPGPASNLIVTAQPTDGIILNALTPAFAVAVVDEYGNINGDYSGDVTVSLEGGDATATLSGTLVRTPVAGTATFEDLVIDKPDVGYIVVANAPLVAGITSDPFDVDLNFAAIHVVPSSDTLRIVGDTVTITAEARDGSGQLVADVPFNWASSDTSVVTVVEGLVTAGMNGTAEVIVSSSGIADTSTITVLIEAFSVVLTSAADTLHSLGDTVSVSAQALDSVGVTIPFASFAWSSSDSAVLSVDGAGVVTAVSDGAAYVRANGGAVTDSMLIVVDQIPTTVIVTPDSITFESTGDTASVSVAVTDGRSNPITGEVTWISRDTGVATVDSTGLVRAQSSGTTYVVAQAGSVMDSAAVVVNVHVSSVTVAPSLDTLRIMGDTLRLTAEARDGSGQLVPDAPFAWTSSNTSVVTVVDGLVTAGMNGTAEVVVSSSGIADTSSITVLIEPFSVSLSSSRDTLHSLGDTVTVSAEALDSVGVPIPFASFTWSSSDSAVFTVDTTGLVTSVGNGQAYVRSTSGAVSDSLLLTVDQVVAGVSVIPETDTLTVLGDTVRFVAAATDSMGSIVGGI